MPLRLALTGDHRCSLLHYDEIPLKDDQLRIKTHLASGKYGTWAAISEGSSFADRRFDHERRLFVEGDEVLCPPPSPEHPLSFGTAVYGTVMETGSAVHDAKPGDVVVAVSADIRETNVVKKENVFSAAGLDPIHALCAEPAYVAFHAIRESRVRYGDSVAVIGLGALGLIAVKMARESGAQFVAAVDPSAGRRALGLRFGADVALDPRDGDTALFLRDATDGKGVDVAIELSGSYAALESAIRCVRMTGTICSAGFYRGEAKDLWLGREWHHNRLEMIVPHGCGWGSPPRDYPRWTERRAYETIFAQMRAGRLGLDGLIDPIVPLRDSTDLFRLCRDEADRVIKFAVRFDT